MTDVGGVVITEHNFLSRTVADLGDPNGTFFFAPLYHAIKRVAHGRELRSTGDGLRSTGNYLSVWHTGLRDHFHMRGLLSANICQRVYISRNRRKRQKNFNFANYFCKSC